LFGTKQYARTLQLGLSVNGEAVELSCRLQDAARSAARGPRPHRHKHGASWASRRLRVLIDGAAAFLPVLAAECEGRA